MAYRDHHGAALRQHAERARRSAGRSRTPRPARPGAVLAVLRPRPHRRVSTGEDAPTGTRTTVLSHDGADLAAALQTIAEIGDAAALAEAVDDAFPGSRVEIRTGDDARFEVTLRQPGMLRALTAAELSDGTLRYLLWAAALLTPRPAELTVLNEPEASLHPELLPALAGLITRASEGSQLVVVTHAAGLVTALATHHEVNTIELTKDKGKPRLSARVCSTSRPGTGRPAAEPTYPWAHARDADRVRGAEPRTGAGLPAPGRGGDRRGPLRRCPGPRRRRRDPGDQDDRPRGAGGRHLPGGARLRRRRHQRRGDRRAARRGRRRIHPGGARRTRHPAESGPGRACAGSPPTIWVCRPRRSGSPDRWPN